MKKHLLQKSKQKNRRQIIRQGLILLLIVCSFVTSFYGFHCYISKVCDIKMIERFVRHDMIVLMPQGALQVEVANTKASRELGLSFRETMNKDEGMLFIFDVPGRYGFWMKDMNFPIDIVWINENGIVVNIERKVSPESYPKVFMNQSDASYVLEMASGLSEKFGLYLGSKVRLTD